MTWEQYGRACRAGCTYSDRGSCGTCAGGCMHHVPTDYTYALSLASACPDCEKCHHDPCSARVRLGASGGDGSGFTWVSCCAAWNYAGCSAAERQNISKIRCQGNYQTDGCPNGGGEAYYEDDDDDGRGFTLGGLMGSIAVMLVSILGGVGVHICYSISAAQHNQTVDSDIEQYLHQLTSSGSAGATFSLLKSFTQVG